VYAYVFTCKMCAWRLLSCLLVAWWYRSFASVYMIILICKRDYILICAYVGTGWQNPIGCLKLQVMFRKRATIYGALLRKMTCKDKASYGSSPPCTYLHPFDSKGTVCVRESVCMCVCVCVYMHKCTHRRLHE